MASSFNQSIIDGVPVDKKTAIAKPVGLGR